MLSQKKVIEEKDWDILIILDACRFDYFAFSYWKYLRGKLEKVKSEGSITPEWLKNTFHNQYMEDVVYVSANPYVNSTDVQSIEGFDSREHFGKIVDVWDYGWDEEERTVLPSTVNQNAEKENGKMIVHYMQPHPPYCNLPFEGFEGQRGLHKKESPLKKIPAKLRQAINKILGRRLVQNLTRWSGLRPEGITESVAEKYDNNTLRLAYLANLKRVLSRLPNLLSQREDDNIVITSDHGQLLGEGGLYGHFHRSTHHILREVPWLEVLSE